MLNLHKLNNGFIEKSLQQILERDPNERYKYVTTVKAWKELLTK